MKKLIKQYTINPYTKIKKSSFNALTIKIFNNDKFMKIKSNLLKRFRNSRTERRRYAYGLVIFLNANKSSNYHF